MDKLSILITGASSGIGAALARHYAGPGVKLILWGRNSERLAAVAEDCRAKKAECETALFDLSDFARLNAELAAAGVPHIAYLNAGLGGTLPPDRVAQDVTSVECMVAVNFTAPLIAANYLAEAMAKHGSGRIVLIGSVAAIFPLPMAPVYSGSKAGLAMFAEALGLRLARHGVNVTLVAPGFIDTPMSQSLHEPRPFLIAAERAAVIIADKVARGHKRIVLPWPFAVLCTLSGLLPRPLLRAVMSLAARQTQGGSLPPRERWL